jgi:hypothetical protein
MHLNQNSSLINQISDEDDGDDFFAFCDDKKRKRHSEPVETPSKRPRSDAAENDPISSSNNDVTKKHLQASVLSTKKRLR